ncbi:MAG: AmmeMemoRadiSam system radical SAM enzyme [Acholeplasmataceae bacterium]|nr:AmmeMemoRadiSam system radical SAM enzyme [Acholeplasmataceae bacterium]
MKEAILYIKVNENKLQCIACNHRCIIEEGGKGICFVREHLQGKLWSLNYGKTVGLNIDPIEKKPLYHFLPGTRTYSFAAAGCNFRCAWCQNWEIAQSPRLKQSIEGIEISPEEHVKRAMEAGCPSISYTYTEPTVFVEYALETMMIAKAKGLKNIWVTNGYMTHETLNKIIPYLDAANVDLKGDNDKIYEEYCGGKVKPVMDNLRFFYREGVHVEITTLVIPGVNDKKEQLDVIAKFIAKELGSDVPWHISRFFPAWKMQGTSVTPVKTLEMAELIGKNAGLHYIHLGNV